MIIIGKYKKKKLLENIRENIKEKFGEEGFLATHLEH